MTQRLVQVENHHLFSNTRVLHFDTVEECRNLLQEEIVLLQRADIQIRVSPQREGAFQRKFFTEGVIPKEHDFIWVRIVYSRK